MRSYLTARGVFAICHFQNYLAYFRQHHLAYLGRPECCANLSPCRFQAQYNFATPKAPPLEARDSVAESSVCATYGNNPFGQGDVGYLGLT